MSKRKKPTEPQLPPATISEYRGVRSLHLGSIWIQGSMCLARPDRIELEYVQRMLAALLWLPLDELHHGHAVQLGLGAASLTRFALKALRMRCTAVELNPSVIALCRRSFKLPADSTRLQVLNMDAADWVRDVRNRQSAQLLQVDLYDQEAAAPVLDDAAFYAACREVLADGGVMSVNLFGRDARYERSIAHVADAFGPAQVCRLRPTREGNSVVLAGRDVRMPDRAMLLERAQQIEARFGQRGLPARKWLRMLRPLGAPAASTPDEAPLPDTQATAPP